jgi:alkanesulfonate monooxygenase SsuD/methylene tetrahydromethanopterin reductase-like flavin-dependent oxidoreductase (luciferase family)
VYLMRFDMRTAHGGPSTTELYRTVLEMAGWGEEHGAVVAVLCEHHGIPDGYLPAPMTLASALAARTTKLAINVSVVVLPLYDPIRLAEEMCVLDIISEGRVSYTAAIGYLPHEYEMYGVDFHRRGKIAEEKLSVLLRARSGEPFDHEGRHIHVTPPPVTPGGPSVSWGGGSLAAARRAGRHGIGFFGQKDDPALGEAYVEEARAHGHEPGMCFLPPRDSATTVFVAEDIDEAWDELGAYLMHDVRSYAEWNEGDTDVTSTSAATTAEELRAENRSHRILTVDEAVEMVRGGNLLALHPLVGGLPPDLGWKYLRIVGEKVIPALG